MAKKILTFALSPLAGIASAIIGKKKKATAEPVKDGPVVMPLADDEAIKRARRTSISSQMSRGGRSSTILSNDSDTLGG